MIQLASDAGSTLAMRAIVGAIMLIPSNQLNGVWTPLAAILTSPLQVVAIGVLLCSCLVAQADEQELLTAIESAKWSRVTTLLKSQQDVAGWANAKQPDGMTALHWAAFHLRPQLCVELIRLGADPNAATEYKITPLIIVCQNTPGGGKKADAAVAIAKALLEAGASVETAAAARETPLMFAARCGNADLVQTLLDNGADPNKKNSSGQTALMWAAHEGNAQAVKHLLAGDADRDLSLKSGFNAWFFAARQGQQDVVELLLDSGVDINSVMSPERTGERRPRKKMSALMLAVESGHFELAISLLDRGADPNDQRSGFTPLHAISWVRKANRGDDPSGDPTPRGSGKVHSLQFVRAIVQRGADVNSRLKNGPSGRAKLHLKLATPFILASRTADLALMKLLLELGADPTINNVDDCSPLMAAAGVGVVAVGEEAGTEDEVVAAIELLSRLGLDPNHVDKNGETAMHGAAYRNFPRAVEALAKAGAKSEAWDHKNRHGWTPVMIAQGQRPGSFKPSPATVKALRDAME